MRKYLVLLKLRLMVWLGIDRNSKNIITLYEELYQLREILKERTEYHVDVHSYAKRNSQVILIGKFRNNDFVKCYNIPDESFEDLRCHCYNLEKYSRLGKVDAHPEFSAAIKHDIKIRR